MMHSVECLLRQITLNRDRRRQLAGDIDYTKLSESNTSQLLKKTTNWHTVMKTMAVWPRYQIKKTTALCNWHAKGRNVPIPRKVRDHFH